MTIEAPDKTSWVPGAETSGFSLACLPYGVGAPPGDGPRLFVAVGDYALDLAAVAEARLLGPAIPVGGIWRADTLLPLIEAGCGVHRQLRQQLVQLLGEGSSKRMEVEPHLLPLVSLDMHLPLSPPDFADFYASYHHALRSTSAVRGEPAEDVEANWKAMPLGYHARSGTVIGPEAEIRRQNGQYRSAGSIVTGASRALDFELEMGIILGRGSPLGERVPAEAFEDHVFGLTLLNDWSARDLQRWESFPLGPFNAKSFATQIGPWVVPIEALMPFGGRTASQASAAPYLCHDSSWTFDIELEAFILSAEMRRRGIEPLRITQSNLAHLHWDPAQLLAHLTLNGASTRAGDLIGTGTVSGPEIESAACLLEITNSGRSPLRLPDGTDRAWLEDGDEVILSAIARRGDRPLLSFGQLSGRVASAHPLP